MVATSAMKEKILQAWKQGRVQRWRHEPRGTRMSTGSTAARAKRDAPKVLEGWYQRHEHGHATKHERPVAASESEVEGPASAHQPAQRAATSCTALPVWSLQSQ